MDRSSWAYVYRHLNDLPKRRRYSMLSEADLQALWTEVGVTVSAHMLNKRVCVSVPFVGRFVVGHPSPLDGDPSSYVPHFAPAQSFTKIRGLHGTRHNLMRVRPTEVLNCSAIASATAFTRDDVELGIKDIALGMLRVVKERESAVFPLPGVGRIIFGHGQARLKYDAAFCAAMKAPPPECAQAYSIEPPDDMSKQNVADPPPSGLKKEAGDAVQAPNCHHSLSQNQRQPASPPAAESNPPALKDAPGERSQTTSHSHASSSTEAIGGATPGHRSSKDGGSGSVQEQCPAFTDPLLERLKRTVLASEVRLPFVRAAVEHARKKADATKVRASTLTDPPSVPEGMHLHSNSGNRLWKDHKCPVCRAKAKQFADMREDAKRKEKEFDKMIVRLSMEIDQQLALKEKAAEEAKAKECAATADYNLKTILQKEEERKSAKEEKRQEKIVYSTPQQRPREWNQQLADDLKKQIAYHRSKMTMARETTELEAKLSNQLAAKELKEAQLKEQLKDLERKDLHRAALRWQIQYQKEREARIRRVNDIPFEDDFTADDGDKRASDAVIAKKLLDEQIHVLKLRREIRMQEGERQRLLSKKLLETMQQELRADNQRQRRQKWETRKTLETLWRDQNVWREQLAAVYRD